MRCITRMEVAALAVRLIPMLFIEKYLQQSVDFSDATCEHHFDANYRLENLAAMRKKS